MGDFVTGILKKNEIGAMDHDGVVYDRWLTLSLGDDKELEIFDSGAFSGNIPIGKLYRTILWAYDPPFARYSLDRPSVVKSDECFGTIVDPKWQAPKINYLCASDTLYRGYWILIDTTLGWVLMSDTQFKVSLSPGGFIHWKASRFHLLAII